MNVRKGTGSRVLGGVSLIVAAVALLGVCAEVGQATSSVPVGDYCKCAGCNLTVCNGDWMCANIATNRQTCYDKVRSDYPNACQAESDQCARFLDWSLGFPCWRERRKCGGQLAYITNS